jgi:hypothetical protein
VAAAGGPRVRHLITQPASPQLGVGSPGELPAAHVYNLLAYPRRTSRHPVWGLEANDKPWLLDVLEAFLFILPASPITTSCFVG